MRLRDEDAMDPEVERELAAIDSALAGEMVDPDLSDLAELSADLSGMRPTLEEEFAAELDRRAAAGFESEGPERFAGAKKRWADFRESWPAWQLAPVAGSLLVVLVIAVGAVSVSLRGNGSDDSGSAATSAGEAQVLSGSPASADAETDTALPAPEAQTAQDLSAGASIPNTLSLPRAGAPTGPFASDQRRRAIERNAQITLGTDPENVQQVSSDVLGVVGRYGGIVLNSSVEDGPAGDAGATFELLIPSERLGGALADLSEVAEVRSREETTTDITAPTVTTQERLQDARAEVEGLLKQLANADTDDERASVEAQLSFQRQRIAGLRSTLSKLERRANLSRVSLDIVTGDAASFGEETGEGWGVADAIDDAGKILGTAAGISLVTLAVALPFAILALLFWLGRRGFVTSARRRALEG